MNAKECAAYHRGFRAGQKDERANIATTIALLGLDMEIARELATAVQNERAIREAPKRVSHDEHVRLTALAGVMPWASRWEMVTAARDRIDALIARLKPERSPAAASPRPECATCGDSGRMHDASGAGPWDCYACRRTVAGGGILYGVPFVVDQDLPLGQFFIKSADRMAQEGLRGRA